MINITINNKQIQVEEGTTILQAAKQIGIKIPTLCYLDICSSNVENKPASCRVCVVEIEGKKNLAASCSTDCLEGMVIKTNSKKALDGRRTMVELLLSDHPYDCLACSKDTNCQLQKVASEVGVKKVRYEGIKSLPPIDESSASMRRDPSKCIMCRRCETVCNQVQSVGVYTAVERGFEAYVSTAQNTPIAETQCTFCGQCVNVCPTGALMEKSDIEKLYDALDDKTKTVIVQTAPAVRVALGEEFGLPMGSRVTGKMVSALKEIGFDKVMDTDFGADLTIMEEANELVERIKNNGPFPMITSCCPAWVKFIEHNFPEMLHLPSSCKSPHEMFGAIAKTYFAEKIGVDKKDIVVVSVMPCIAKKYECDREEMVEDVDFVITTRELAKVIKEFGIDFNNLEESDFDKFMGESSGAGDIFGTTGGVIEAATRTAVSWLQGENIEKVDFEDIRGLEGIRSANVTVDGLEVKIGIAHGLANARLLMNLIKYGEVDYHAVEIMACPGGCINGGGQPYHDQADGNLAKRASGLYAEDSEKKIRLSHENTEIKELYSTFLDKPGSHKAHELLHTSYTKRNKYSN